MRKCNGSGTSTLINESGGGAGEADGEKRSNEDAPEVEEIAWAVGKGKTTYHMVH
jgi:hypothetical protein